MSLPVETIPTSVVVTNLTTQDLKVGFGVVIPASASNLTIDLSKLRGASTDVRGDSPKERTWQGLVEMSRTTAARATALITLVSTTPNILPLTTGAYAVANPVKTVEANVLRPGIPGFANDGQGPYIASLTRGVGYIDVAFDGPVFNNVPNLGGAGAGVVPTVSDFTFVFNDGPAGATACTLTSITKTTGAALTGGESTIRFNISVTGTALATDTVTIGLVAGALRDADMNKNLAGSKTVALA
jgi:hypothetical protein